MEHTILNNVNEVYHFISTCNPYKIRKAVLNENGTDREIYFVALRGTNGSLKSNDPLGIPACIRAGFSKDNIYKRLVKKAIYETVPKGSELYFAGHSLGGMVCQHLGADNDLNKDYKIFKVLTIGSPYIIHLGREFNLKRLADKNDIVPRLCSTGIFINTKAGNISFENYHSFGKLRVSHCDAYEFSRDFAKYDCLGIKGGTAFINIEESD